MQLAELAFRHGAGGLDHEVLPALRLREGDHVADLVHAGHHRHHAVEAEGDAAVRRSAVRERIEQEAELGARLLVADSERLELLRLHLRAVDPHGAAADLPAVQRDVVGLREHLAGIGVHERHVLVLRARERMVRRQPALAFLVVFVGGEVDHPARAPAGIGVALLVAHLRAQRAHRVVHHLAPVRAEEDHVAVLRAGALENRREFRPA